MVEIFQYAIPVTIAVAGLFHLFLAEMFAGLKEQKGLIWLWVGFAFLLIFNAVFAAHKIALDPSSVDLSSATRTAYLLVMGSGLTTFLFVVIMGFKRGADSSATFFKNLRRQR